MTLESHHLHLSSGDSLSPPKATLRWFLVNATCKCPHSPWHIVALSKCSLTSLPWPIGSFAISPDQSKGLLERSWNQFCDWVSTDHRRALTAGLHLSTPALRFALFAHAAILTVVPSLFSFSSREALASSPFSAPLCPFLFCGRHLINPNTSSCLG